MAPHLWAQVQPQTRRRTHRQTRPGIQAPVVHAGKRDHYGRRKTNLLCATARRPFSRCSLRRPCLLLEKAPQGEIAGVHRMYGSRLLGQTSLARIHLALVMRNRQLLLEDPGRTGRLPCPVLRSGGQIHRRRSFGLGLRRAAFRSGAFRPTKTYGDIIRRHRDEHAIDWLTGSYPNGDRYRRCPISAPAFLAFGNTTGLVPDHPPSYAFSGFMSISSPGCSRTPPHGQIAPAFF